MSTWKKADSEWHGFLEKVRAARAAVGSTYAGAWFRGQSDNWDLNPSLFRHVQSVNEQVKSLDDLVRQNKKKLKEARAWLRKNGRTKSDRKTAELEQDLNHAEARKRRLERLIPADGHIPNEGRAFIEFKFRSGKKYSSSWEQLSEMQHYGVPTRLLDWSESFIHAVAFALSDYVEKLSARWQEDRASGQPPELLRFHDVSRPMRGDAGSGDLKEPTLWILNPYRLARRSKGHNILWDMTISPQDDYYDMFINFDRGGSSRFTLPVPVLSPWRDARLAAQQGVFTCHGSDARALNEMFDDRVIQPIRISHLAAIAGVRFLRESGGLDKYSMFRDIDSLGEKTKSEFLDL